jgi:hypothetical protein
LTPSSTERRGGGRSVGGDRSVGGESEGAAALFLRRDGVRGSVGGGGVVLERWCRRRLGAVAPASVFLPVARVARQKREGGEAFSFHPSPTGFGRFHRA